MQEQAITTALVGLVSTLVTELLKRIDSVPLSAGQVKAISTTVAVLSFAGNFFAALGSRSLATDSGVQAGTTLVVQTGISWLIAHGTYAGVLTHLLPASQPKP